MEELETVMAPDIDQPASRDWSSDQEEALRVWIALARCYSTFSRAVAIKIQEYGLTTPQFGVLEALYHLGPLSLGDLAGKLLVTGGNVTYVMDRLEDHGFVYRERSPEDRRVIQAKLTEKGRSLIDGVFQGHAEYVDHLTRHLEQDERAELRRLLKKLGTGVARQDLRSTPQAD
jgi:MarR family transcriptional regulator, 2-MHQ and catechol-resistance regulon repressor